MINKIPKTSDEYYIWIKLLLEKNGIGVGGPKKKEDDKDSQKKIN